MNPFNNNKPQLTASDRIRDKRDAVIYQAAKQQFQNKKCGKNVKYYNNGTIRSMNSYGLQKSLARGSVLCEDCNGKGSLCNGPSEKDQLNNITMGNNYVSEYRGGAKFQNFAMDLSECFVVMTDISGNPNGFDASGVVDYFFSEGLVYESTYGITIDPSNILFTDELCDPYRYLQKTNIKTYLVITADISGATCFGSSANIVDYMVDISGISGVIKSVCCKGPAMFDIFVELFYINNYGILGYLLRTQTYPEVDISGSTIKTVTNIRIFQGSIPVHGSFGNATRQSYMSCLENGTRKINFTQQNIEMPVINSFC